MNRKCFITYQFKTGGVEKLFLTLAEGLQEEIYLLRVYSDSDRSIQEIPGNVCILSVPRIIDKIRWKPARYILFLLTFYCKFRWKKEFKELIFVNMSDTLSTLFATYIFSREKRKYSWVQVNPRVLAQSRFYRLYSFLYARMNKIICICHSQKLLFASLFPKIADHQVTVIPNCINPSKIDQAKVVPFEYPDKQYILMVARLDMRSKDFYTLIDAYDQLHPAVKSSYDLLLLGEGPDRFQIEQYIQNRSLQRNVKLAGQDPNPYKWMYHAALYVHSSKTEGFGLVLLEALQCGIPIIATDCETGPAEILQNGKYGVVVPVGNTEALCRAMLYLLTREKGRFDKAEGILRAKQYDVLNSVQKLKKIIV